MTVSSWQPASLLEAVLREPLATLRKRTGPAPFLIVRLDDFNHELGLGLAAADEAKERRRFNQAIKSTLQISSGMTEQLRLLRTEQPLTHAPFEEAPTGPRAGFPVPQWLCARCYVVRLSSRVESNAPISIGRDPSHKIVLQHPSVSATHAYLTIGPELSLRDAKSRNGTLVNGAAIKGSAPVRPGDLIKFGAVQALLCSADDLWHALR